MSSASPEIGKQNRGESGDHEQYSRDHRQRFPPEVRSALMTLEQLRQVGRQIHKS